MATPSILEVEQAIVGLLEAPLLALKTKTIGFPDDFEDSGRVYNKNHAIVGFAGFGLEQPAASGILGCTPVQQKATWNYTILLSSSRLSKGNPSTPAMYQLIDATIDAVCGKRPFEILGPLWVSGVDYAGREDGFYQYTVSVQMDGKRACSDNATLVSVWEGNIA